MTKIKFYKMQAGGNDFIVINNLNSQLSVTSNQLSDLAKNLCQRRFSIGADGLLLLEPSQTSDFKMRIFNPDGQEAEMCGNGIRCAGLLANKEAIVSDNNIRIETMAGVKKVIVGDRNAVKVNIGETKDVKLNINLKIGDNLFKVNYVNTGVPHVIIFADDLDKFPVCKIGRAVRYHENFEPDGTNVDFVKIAAKDTIDVRTYERGVEDETFGCGTGMVASVLIAYRLSLINANVVKVHTKSKKVLRVSFDIENGKFCNIYLEGKVNLVYTGEIK